MYVSKIHSWYIPKCICKFSNQYIIRKKIYIFHQQKDLRSCLTLYQTIHIVRPSYWLSFSLVAQKQGRGNSSLYHSVFNIPQGVIILIECNANLKASFNGIYSVSTWLWNQKLIIRIHKYWSVYRWKH